MYGSRKSSRMRDIGLEDNMDLSDSQDKIEAFVEEQEDHLAEIEDTQVAVEELCNIYYNCGNLSTLMDQNVGNASLEGYAEKVIRGHVRSSGLPYDPSMEGFIDSVVKGVKNIFRGNPTKLVEAADTRKIKEINKEIEKLIANHKQKLSSAGTGSKTISDKALLDHFRLGGAPVKDVGAAAHEDATSIVDLLGSYTKYSDSLFGYAIGAINATIKDGDFAKHSENVWRQMSAIEGMPAALFKDNILMQSKRLKKIDEYGLVDGTEDASERHFTLMIMQPGLELVNVPTKGEQEAIEIEDVKKVAGQLIGALEEYHKAYKEAESMMVDMGQHAMPMKFTEGRLLSKVTNKDENRDANFMFLTAFSTLLAMSKSQKVMTAHAGRSIKAVNALLDHLLG